MNSHSYTCTSYICVLFFFTYLLIYLVTLLYACIYKCNSVLCLLYVYAFFIVSHFSPWWFYLLTSEQVGYFIYFHFSVAFYFILFPFLLVTLPFSSLHFAQCLRFSSWYFLFNRYSFSVSISVSRALIFTSRIVVVFYLYFKLNVGDCCFRDGRKEMRKRERRRSIGKKMRLELCIIVYLIFFPLLIIVAVYTLFSLCCCISGKSASTLQKPNELIDSATA